ncbi:MAG: OmpA family protein [Myxococcota bacterium]
MLRRVAIVLSMLGGVACASTPTVAPLGADPVVPGAGERVNVSHAYIVVDSSDSVREAFPTEKALVQSFVAAMPDGEYEVAGIAFGGYERQASAPEKFNRKNAQANADALEHLGEGTPLDRAILELQPLTQGKFGHGAVVIFSDGHPTDPIGRELDSEQVVAAARTLREGWEGRLCFYTVQVGDDAEGAAFLKRLSEATDCGGTRTLAGIQNVAALQNFEREIFFGAAPVVAAAPGDADGDGITDDKDQCPGTPLGVTPDGRGCWTLPGIQFAFDSADIKNVYDDRLDELTKVLRDNPGMKLAVDGHTDSVGPEGYNQGLSQRRAKSVHDYLVSKGIDDDRIHARGFGESRPAASNDTKEGRALNRRTELTALER